MLFGVVAFCLNILDWCYLNAIDFLGSTLKISIVSGIIGGASHIPKWNWGSCYSKISDWLWRMARQKPTHSLHGSTPQDAIVASLKACRNIRMQKWHVIRWFFTKAFWGGGRSNPYPSSWNSNSFIQPQNTGYPSPSIRFKMSFGKESVEKHQGSIFDVPRCKGKPLPTTLTGWAFAKGSLPPNEGSQPNPGPPQHNAKLKVQSHSKHNRPGGFKPGKYPTRRIRCEVKR